jgi:hypothetical protein
MPTKAPTNPSEPGKTTGGITPGSTALGVNSSGSTAASRSGDPFAQYVVDATQESPACLSANKSSAISDQTLSPLDDTKGYQPPDRPQEVSLQPLTATTVEIVPTVLAGEIHEEEQPPRETAGQGVSFSPDAIPANVIAPIFLVGLTDFPSADKLIAAPTTPPPGEHAVQRYLLGVDQVPAPNIGPGGTTTQRTALAEPSLEDETPALVPPPTPPAAPIEQTPADQEVEDRFASEKDARSIPVELPTQEKQQSEPNRTETETASGGAAVDSAEGRKDHFLEALGAVVMVELGWQVWRQVSGGDEEGESSLPLLVSPEPSVSGRGRA